VALNVVVLRENREEALTVTPRLQEIKDNFGNTHRVGLLGISRSTTQEDVITERYGPVEPCVWASRKPGSCSNGRSVMWAG
jgi:regulator of sigma E protease